MRAPISVLLGLLMSFYTSSVYAGAWVLDNNQVEYILTASYSTAESQFDRAGNQTRTVDFSKLEAGVFAEFGLTDDWTLGAKGAINQIALSSVQTDISFSEIGPFEIWARRRIWAGKHSVLSIQLTSAFEGRFADNYGDQISDGSFAGEGRILMGRSVKIGPNYGFVEGQLGYYLRKNEGIDEVRADIAMGYNFSPTIEWINQAFWVQSTGASQNALDYRRLKLQSTLYIKRSDERAYQLGLLKTVSGRNSLKEIGGFIGTVNRF